MRQVASEFRHHGIGVAMMNRISQWAASSGIAHVGLVADDSVASFYRQWPLQTTGRFLRFPHPAGSSM
ncbi:GNAT family N-acetyltransferase [Nocardia sp. GAS34]|uniref:GNAT family N-acetyltransferase n=1 Tax=unclassified Nocardia TaxID=2637762 RepID=UPI003D1A9A09